MPLILLYGSAQCFHPVAPVTALLVAPVAFELWDGGQEAVRGLCGRCFGLRSAADSAAGTGELEVPRIHLAQVANRRVSQYFAQAAPPLGISPEVTRVVVAERRQPRAETEVPRQAL
eukprot:CAMPEP_0119084958 /NCGR_PEP_ID=MMETSP1178-20130426/131730_1 /TAXON_ID=33656 /ORGANISM="unid sp, Strain CCMP2000" /LENGTH=116 /DNA_ID=CAMNT_0007067957 /DNA_START=34 /DNA_END=383 /DNA_ORIENTATION=+